MPRSNRAARAKSQSGKAGRTRPRPPRILSTKRCVSHKRPYSSEIHATIELNNITRLGATREKMPVRVYRCEKCGYWHLTSKPGKANYVGQLDDR